ncbi:hypothetical protein Tco_0588519 [Tanacetum coccineum]
MQKTIKNFPTALNTFDALNNLVDVDDGGGSKTLSAQEANHVEVHCRKDKHADVPNSSSCDQPPIVEKEVNLKPVDMPSTSTGEQIVKLRMFMMTQLDTWLYYPNRACGGANDVSLLEDEDCDIYDGYENDAYDGLTEDQLACDAYDISDKLKGTKNPDFRIKGSRRVVQGLKRESELLTAKVAKIIGSELLTASCLVYWQRVADGEVLFKWERSYKLCGDAEETEVHFNLVQNVLEYFQDLSAKEKEKQHDGSTSTDNLIESLTNTLALLNQSLKAHLPQTNNQLRTSSNARNNATVQDGRVVVQDVRGRYNANNQGRPFQRNNARGNVVAGNVGGQNRDSDYFKDKMLLMNAHENGAVLDEEQLLFLAGEQVTNFDDDVDDLALNVDHVFEADQCDAFDSDVDEAPTTQTMFMATKSFSSEDQYTKKAGTSYDSNYSLFWNALTHDAKTRRSLLHDNIVPKPDLALELGKSISLTEAEEEAVAREVHATHARIVSESEPKPTQRRQSGIAFRDSFIVSKKRSSDSTKKFKGIQTLTPAKQEAADIMKALKESKKMSKRQPGTGGSNEGTGNILGVPDESTVISRASSEGTGSKTGVPDEEKLILEWEADVDSEHFDRDDNAGDDNEETKPDPEEIYK